MSGMPSIDVSMHPAYWSTVLRHLRVAREAAEERAREEVRAGRMRAVDAAAWLGDIELATGPIVAAVRDALLANPTWVRWFDNDDHHTEES